MAAPAFSPKGGVGSTYTDPQTGTTYRFAGGTNWQQISSGARSNGVISNPIPPSASLSTGPQGGGGGPPPAPRAGDADFAWSAGGNNFGYGDEGQAHYQSYMHLLDDTLNEGNKLIDQMEKDNQTNRQEEEINLGKFVDTETGKVNRQQKDLIAQQELQKFDQDRTFQSALSQAVRTLNALNQQAKSRFGFGSSAGGALGELAQQEFFRQQGNIGASQVSTQKSNDLELNRIKDYTLGKLDDIETYKRDAMNKIRQTFTDSLNNLKTQRFQLGTARNTAKIELLQNALAQAQAVRQADQQFRQNLALNYISKAQELNGQLFEPRQVNAIIAGFQNGTFGTPDYGLVAPGPSIPTALPTNRYEYDSFGNLIDPLSGRTIRGVNA